MKTNSKIKLSLFMLLLLFIPFLLNGYITTAYAETSGDWDYSITNEDEKTASITGYSGNKANVTIPSEIDGYKITSIGDSAFEDNILLKSIVIPEDVTSIGKSAFRACSSLKNISIPDSTESIGMNAFADCLSLKSIYIPKNITSIDSYVWYNCPNIDSIVVDTDNTVYDSRNNCNALIHTSTNTLLKGSNTTIIPNDITTIKGKAFAYLSELDSIIIPNSVENIEMDSFYGCKSLKNVVLPSNITVINSNTFKDCISLESIIIPSEVETIGTSAFNNCNKLKSVTMVENVTTINSNAFNKCVSLESIVFPNTLTTIGDSAFSGCTSLKSISIPASVTQINYSAFNKCSNLESITVDSNNTTYDSRNNSNALIKTATNELIQGSKNTVIPDTVTSIYNKAFTSVGITSINIPSSVTSIGSSAFMYCDALTSVTFNEGLERIESNAFDSCSSLNNLTIPATITSIGYGAFYGCSSLTSITVDSNNTKYDSRNNCNAIIETETNKLLYGCKNTVIVEGINSIENRAFYNCEGLKSITLPQSLIAINTNSFEGCTEIESITVTEGNAIFDSRNNCNAIIETANNKLIIACKNTKIPSDVTIIGSSSFRNRNIERIEIPNSVTTIENNAFRDAKMLREVFISASVTNIGSDVFADCDSLTKIVVDSNNSVYDSRNNCNAIIKTQNNELVIGCKTTVIPNDVTSIAQYAFYYIDNIEYLVIPENCINFDSNSFRECSNITLEIMSYDIKFTEYSFGTCQINTIYCLPDSYAEALAIKNGANCIYNISGATIALESEKEVYNGDSIIPTVVLTAGESTFVEGTDYDLTYSDNINAGTATVTVTGKGKCIGTLTKTFVIEPVKITDVILETTEYTYDGQPKTPSVVVKSADIAISEENYDLTYSSNVNVGTATVEVVGKGNYTGTISKTFTIKANAPSVDEPTEKDPTEKDPVVEIPEVKKPAKITSLKQLLSYAQNYIKLSWKKVADADGYEIYRATSKNGKYKLVKTTTKTNYQDKNLSAGKNYFYKVKAYKNVEGGKLYGQYSAITKMITKSKAPSIKAKRSTKTKARLTWAKVTGADGYEVYMKTGKNGKYKKVTTLSSKKVSYTKTKLKKNTKYSFKVRAYRKVGNSKVYSAWSKVKTV